MIRPVIAVAVALGFSACGKADEKPIVIATNNGGNGKGGNTNGGGNTNVGGDNGEEPTIAPDQAPFYGFTIPANAQQIATGAAHLTLEAVISASVAANGGTALQTSGTLTQSAAGFSYTATPTDRLVIAWSEGAPTDIYVQQIDGDFDSPSVDDFFERNHVVQARVVRSGFNDITVASSKSGTSRNGSVQGTITQAGVEYTLNLHEAETVESEVDVGTTYKSNSSLTGTITSAALQMTINETSYYRSVYFESFAENMSSTIDNTWTHDGNEYAAADVFMRSAFTDALPAEPEFWRAEGILLENGSVIGEVTSEETEFFIRMVLVLTNGEKLTLREFNRHVN